MKRTSRSVQADSPPGPVRGLRATAAAALGAGAVLVALLALVAPGAAQSQSCTPSCPRTDECCGNCICDVAAGEDLDTCAEDCSVCRDGLCTGEENAANCPRDCATCAELGGEECGESPGVCPEGYRSLGLSNDCGQNPCCQAEASPPPPPPPTEQTVTVSATDGQTPLALTPGGPAGSFALSGFDTANLYNGNLGFALPLLAVGGRGEAGYTMTLPIDRRWSLAQIKALREEPKTLSPRYWLKEEPWLRRPGYSPGTLMARRATQDLAFSTGGTIDFAVGLTRLTLTRPDGTEQELRDELYRGEPQNWPGSGGLSRSISRGRVFTSADGTAMTFQSDADIEDAHWAAPAPLGVTGRLLFKDGTQYTLEGGRVRQIRDRNGNRVAFAYDGSGRLVRAEDSLGRVTSVSYAADADVIAYSGFAGAPREIRVEYAPLAERLYSSEPDVEGPGLTPALRRELFPAIGMWLSQADESFNPRVVSRVVLPNGLRYGFKYNVYGELTSVVLPTGGRIEYGWTSGVANDPSGLYAVTSPHPWSPEYGIYRRLKWRKTYNLSAGEADQWTGYSLVESCPGWSAGICVDSVSRDAGNGSTLVSERHYFHGNPLDSYAQAPCGYPGWRQGREARVEVLDAGGTLLRRQESEWAQREAVGWWTGRPADEPPNDVRLTSASTTLETNETARVDYGYDEFNNVTQKEERDHGGALLRRTRREYLKGQHSAWPVHIRDLVSSEAVEDGNGNLASQTSYAYDEPGLVPRPGITGWQDVGTLRGDATTTSAFLDQPRSGEPNQVVTRRAYDVAGNVVRVTDPLGRVTTIDYADNFGGPDGSIGGGQSRSTFAFPTTWTPPLARHAVRTQYDYATGRPVDQQDANGTVTSLRYDDGLDRLTLVTRGANAAAEAGRSRTLYSYSPRSVTTEQDQDAVGDGLRKSRLTWDQFGREWRTEQWTGTDWIAVEKRYDARGRLMLVSNPYLKSEDEARTETPVWTETGYDALDRPVRVVTPDGAVVTTSYSGRVSTVWDAAGRSRRSETDALGRVVSVVEAPGAEGYETSYGYDALDRLREVRQSAAQRRSFGYDSLGRLRSSESPESAQTRYEYDLVGNLTKRVDGRGVVTTSEYDSLNRLRSRSYSDGTPPVRFTYDQDGTAGAFAVGRLTAVETGPEGSPLSRTEYHHDAVGRVFSSTQTTEGQTFSFRYTWNRAGEMTSGVYPSGRTVETPRDVLGRLTAVTDMGRTLASGFLYTRHGALRQVSLANGLTETSDFNSRLQPTCLALGPQAEVQQHQTCASLVRAGSTAVPFALEWRYSPAGSPPAVNNGNVWAQTTWIPKPGVPTPVSITQTYGYDWLNRLTSAVETGGWRQAYVYDRFGNRALTPTSDIPQPALTPTDLDQHIDRRTNRLRLGSATYDGAGNLIADPLGRAITYDAENRQTAFNSGSGTGGELLLTRYSYDGEGRRVKAVGPTGTTTFVYDALGRLAAEYGDGTPPEQGTKYLTTDTLGSNRLVTDEAGRVVARHDYLPFGEEIPASFAGRDQLPDYASLDPTRHRFTGKERDKESGLDYFGARYFSGAQGRFTSPDVIDHPSQSAIGQGNFLLDPQRFNKYAYVQNNPLAFTDPDGAECPYVRLDKNTVFVSGLGIQRIPEATMGQAARDTALLAGAITTGLFAPGAAAALRPAVIPGATVVSGLARFFDLPGWVERGRQIETFLADRFGGGLPGNFPVIDRFLNGAATSVKSIDLGAKTYQSASRLFSALVSYIDKLGNFTGARFAGAEVWNITSKTLEVVVPANAKPEQIAAIVKAAQYANEAGINFRVIMAR